MRRATVSGIALAVGVALLLGGCSGGAKKPAASPPPSTSATSAPPAPAVNQSNDPYCVFLRGYNDRFNRIDLGATDPQAFQRVMQEAAAAAKEAEATAPPAIRSDVVTLNRAFERLLGALQQINFDMTKATPALLQELQTPELLAAGQRIDAYTRQNCI